MSDEKEYTFTRLATYTEVGNVFAKNEEEARRKIIDGQYCDIHISMLENEDNTTIEISEA